MRELKIMTGIVYFCVAGVAVSLGGGIYTAIQLHREANAPHPSVFPTPASGAPGAPGTTSAPAVQHTAPGGLPTPAQ
jgi:hypothetical protein